MTTRQKVFAIAKQLGVTIDDSMYHEVKCEAPHGTIWACSLVHEIVCTKDTKEPMSVIWNDLLERMSYGIEKCEDDNCEWCEGI